MHPRQKAVALAVEEMVTGGQLQLGLVQIRPLPQQRRRQAARHRWSLQCGKRAPWHRPGRVTGQASQGVFLLEDGLLQLRHQLRGRLVPERAWVCSSSEV